MIKRKIDVNSDAAFETSCQNNNIVLTAKGANSKPVSYIDLNGQEKIINSKKLPKNSVFDPFYVGDTVKVHAKVKKGKRVEVQVFEGTVLKIRNNSHSRGVAFTIKVISDGIGIKKTWLMDSPNLAKVEVVHRGDRERLKYFKERIDKKVKTIFNSRAVPISNIGYCAFCGAQLNESIQFCTNCGAMLRGM